MITSLILLLVYGLVYALISPFLLLDDVTASSTIVTSFNTGATYIANFNGFLPLGSIFTVLFSILVFELILATYKIVMWVIRRIPTQS